MFYGQWNPPVDEVLFRNYFTDKTDGFFIEAGAGDGVLENCCLFFERERGWTGLNIEPCIANFKQLAANRPNAINMNVGLGESDCMAAFTRESKDMYIGGEFEMTVPQKEAMVRRGFALEDVEIPVITYKRAVDDRFVFLKKVELLVLDVEGYELKAIGGMAGSTLLPSVICVEYPVVGLERIREVLIPMGYRYDFFSFNNAFFALPEVPSRPPWFGASSDLMGYGV